MLLKYREIDPSGKVVGRLKLSIKSQVQVQVEALKKWNKEVWEIFFGNPTVSVLAY